MNAKPRSTRHGRAGPARGMVLPAVIFVIVIVGGLIAALALMVGRGASGAGLEIRASRALAAARAGTEWAAWQVRDPAGTLAPGAGTLPACPAASTTLTLPTPLDEFTVTVTCVRTPTGTPADEGGLLTAFYEIEATAASGSLTSADRVERKLQARIETCKNPAGLAPTYAC